MHGYRLTAVLLGAETEVRPIFFLAATVLVTILAI